MLEQVCKAYDTAEFCRNVHACDVWKAAATQACIKLGGVLARLPDLTSTLRADRSPLLFAQAWNRPATTPRTMVLLQSTWRSSTRMRACTACWSGGWTSLMLQRHAALHCQACLPCQRRPWGSRQSRGVLRGTRRRRCVWGAHSDETLRRRAYTCQGPSGTAWWS